MANPRTPTPLRVLSGNASKRPLPTHEPQFDRSDLNAPDWLTADALATWNKLAPALDVNGMLTTACRDVLATYCATLGAFIAGQRAGEAPDLKALAQIRMMAREFGFTPSSQAGIVAPGRGKDAKPEKARFFA